MAAGCSSPTPGGARDGGLRIATAPPPSAEERYCAWYGAADGDVLYFGEAAFWSAMRAADGDPTADLRTAGPQLVGRFDLSRESLLTPLDVGGVGSRSGVWDVWPAPSGEVWFTTFFEEAGTVDPATGRVRHLLLGGGLNELAAGPAGTVLASRYGSGTARAANGGVVVIDAAGDLAASWPLDAPPGYRVAPKTIAWDPLRAELWVTTDLLPLPGRAGPLRHDAYVLGAGGRLLRRIPRPEVQFVARGPDGTLYRAEVDGSDLELRVVPPPGGEPERLVPLDAAFPAALDFVQDIQPAADGRVAVTRWSGRVHVLHPDRAGGGAVRTVQLPRLEPGGLYYTAVLRGDRLCATYCAGVTVVCADAP